MRGGIVLRWRSLLAGILVLDFSGLLSLVSGVGIGLVAMSGFDCSEALDSGFVSWLIPRSSATSSAV